MGSRDPQPVHIKRGLLVMLSSSVFFAGMAIAIRAMRGDPDVPARVSPYTIAAARFLFGNLFVLGSFATGVSKRRWVNWRWIVVRGLTGGIAAIAYYWAIQELGLAKAVLYAYTYPVFAALLAVVLLGEHLSAKHWGSIGMAFFGMLLVTRIADAPIMRLLGMETPPEAQAITFSVKDMIGLSVGLLSAMAVVALTKCRRTDTAMNIFWSQCIFGLVFAIAPAIYFWTTPTWGEAGMLLLVASLSIAGQLTMTSAYRYTGATYGSVLSLVSFLISAVAAVFAFEEKLSLGFWIGAVMILAPCVYLGIRPVGKGRRVRARA